MALRDAELKKARGYVDPRTKVYVDGREVLFGRDWKQRKIQLELRAGSRCEKVIEGVRCPTPGDDPDHITKRSKLRDDRLANLQLLCRRHHDLKHPEKNKLHWSKR